METKIKRASGVILSMVKTIDPKIPNIITLERAWEVIATYWDLEGEIEAFSTKTSNKARFNIYYQGVIIHTCEWEMNDVWLVKDGEFNFSLIYKDVLEWLIKSRTLKKSRIGKGAKAKQLDLPSAVKKEIKKTSKQQPLTKSNKESDINILQPQDNALNTLKRRKQQLYHKIRNDRKKGLNVSALENEYNEIINKLKTK